MTRFLLSVVHAHVLDLKTSSKLYDSFSLNVQLSLHMVRSCNSMQCLDIRLEAASGM